MKGWIYIAAAARTSYLPKPYPTYQFPLNDNEISLNFRYMYVSYFMSLTILFMIHTVQSPQLYILWPEDGPVQGPKLVVTLHKDKNIR